MLARCCSQICNVRRALTVGNGKYMMPEGVKHILAYAVHINNDVRNSEGRNPLAWKDPSQFNHCILLVILSICHMIGVYGLYDTSTGDKLVSYLYISCFHRFLQN